MRATRIKAAKHIHEQKKKSGTLQSDAVFKVADVDLTNIIDSESYYGGWTMVSSVAGAYATLGLKTAYGDASHMEGKGFNTFGCFFDIGTYSTNRGLCSIVSGHGIGPECHHEWAPRFEAAAAVVGFNVAGRVMVVDLEKSIDTAHDEAMDNGEKFNDERHVLKNMIPKLGPEEKTTGPGLYSRALRAPSKLEVDQIKALYGPRQKAWLARFPDHELYRAYSPGLNDTIVTSQGAESAMNAALANKIRRVEPMAMLKLNAETQQRKFRAEKVLRSVPYQLEVATASCVLCLLHVTCHHLPP